VLKCDGQASRIAMAYTAFLPHGLQKVNE